VERWKVNKLTFATATTSRQLIRFIIEYVHTTNVTLAALQCLSADNHITAQGMHFA
jgi:hypothetical protein